MKFKTISGSEYELDTLNKCVRRIGGKAAPTNRQGKDGNWKNYDNISDVKVGDIVIITYPDGEPLLPGSPEGAIPSTVTSPVKSISDE